MSCECPYSNVCRIQINGDHFCDRKLGLHPLSKPILTKYGFHHGFGTGVDDIFFENKSAAQARVAKIIENIFGPGNQPPPRRTEHNVILKSTNLVLTVRDDHNPSSFLGPLLGCFDLKLKGPDRSFALHLSYKRG